jgi:hypothetical protein
VTKREYVFGPRTKTAPYQQRSGSCKNITVIVTICADGTSIPPAVIFKGNAYVTDFISFISTFSHGPPGLSAPVYIYLDLDTSFLSRASDYY